MGPIPRSSLIKIPQQQRSLQMIHDILDVAMKILEEDGSAGFNTNSVAAAAGISTGSLYQYFANKEMILAGIIERSVLASQQLMRQSLLQTIELPIESLVEQALRLMIAELDPYRKIMVEIFSVQPLLADTSVPATVETFLMDLVRDYLIRNSNRYHSATGLAGIYVAINSAVYMFLKWMVDPPAMVTLDEFVTALTAQVTSAFPATIQQCL